MYSFNKKDSLIYKVDLINLLTYPYRDWWAEHLDNNSLSGLAVEESVWLWIGVVASLPWPTAVGEPYQG